MLDSIQSELDHILEKVILSENNVRFAAICNRHGEITCKTLREGVSTHLNDYETSKLLREAASSWHYRHQLSYKLGQGKFALAVYEKIIRLTIPLDQENLLLLTLEHYDDIPQLVENVHKVIESFISTK